MKVKVWNLEYAPFPREGMNPLLPSEDCQVYMALRKEAAKMARISQLDVPENAAALKRFQKKLRARIWEKLGVTYDRSVPLDIREFGIIEKHGFKIHKLIYQSCPGIYVTALLYVPDGEGPFPAVIHMHGHHSEGKMGDRVQFLSNTLAQNGYVVLAPDCFGVYERATQYREREYHGAYLGGALLNLGQSLMGQQLVDNMRGVDLLLSLPYVDGTRLGATGASGGGNQTMWLSAMDERIQAAMPVVSVGSFESYVTGVNCVCELLPDGLTLTEEAGVLALVAPRPLRLGNAYYDVNPTFGVGEMLKTYHQVEKVYWMLGRPECLAYTVADRVHGMHDRMRDAVLGWLACHLKGEGTGYPIQAPEPEMYNCDELAMFASHEDRPAEVRTIDVHCRLVGEQLHQAYMARPSLNEDAARRELAKVLRLHPLPADIRLHSYAAVEGLERCAVEVGDRLIPFLVKPGTAKGKIKLYLHPDGKEAITDEALAAAAADGSTVVMPDLYGMGETAQQNCILGVNHQFFRQLIWLGRTLPGEWVYDILALVKALKRRYPAGTLSVLAEREAGVCAVFASALLKGAFAVEAVDAPASYVFRRDSIKQFKINAYAKRQVNFFYMVMLPVPGFLQWGDVSLAAALAHGAVTFTAPRAYDGTPLSQDEIIALKAEIKAVGEKFGK